MTHHRATPSLSGRGALRALAIASLTGALALLGCPPNPAGNPGAGECLDDGDCPTGDGLKACVDGQCETVDCLGSNDCPLGTHCDDHECDEGCNDSSDCLSGFECHDDRCVESECRSTVLDCYAGQFCQNGSCVDAGPPVCSSCDPFNAFDQILDDGGTPLNPFDDELLGYVSCGGIGAFCIETATNQYTCGTVCTSTLDCPAAFECVEIVTGDTLEVIGKNCFGPCD